MKSGLKTLESDVKSLKSLKLDAKLLEYGQTPFKPDLKTKISLGIHDISL